LIFSFSSADFSLGFFTLNPSDAASSIFWSFGLSSSTKNPNSLRIQGKNTTGEVCGRETENQV